MSNDRAWERVREAEPRKELGRPERDHVHDQPVAQGQHIEGKGQIPRAACVDGIGAELHEEPQIPNYGTPGRGPRLAEGMVLAIEPMVNAGKPAVKVLADGWTAVTKDRSLSAHFEHTVVVSGDGCRILTLPQAAESEAHGQAAAAAR